MSSGVLMQFAPHMPSLPELLIIAFIGLLIFGKRLPEVGRSLGKGIVEFKKGLRGIEDEVEEASTKDKHETRALPTETMSSPAPTTAEREKEKTKSEVHVG
jgi:sec-independent protein translocase protein TatA